MSDDKDINTSTTNNLSLIGRLSSTIGKVSNVLANPKVWADPNTSDRVASVVYAAANQNKSNIKKLEKNNSYVIDSEVNEKINSGKFTPIAREVETALSRLSSKNSVVISSAKNRAKSEYDKEIADIEKAYNKEISDIEDRDKRLRATISLCDNNIANYERDIQSLKDILDSPAGEPYKEDHLNKINEYKVKLQKAREDKKIAEEESAKLQDRKVSLNSKLQEDKKRAKTEIEKEEANIDKTTYTFSTATRNIKYRNKDYIYDEYIVRFSDETPESVKLTYKNTLGSIHVPGATLRTYLYIEDMLYDEGYGNKSAIIAGKSTSSSVYICSRPRLKGSPADKDRQTAESIAKHNNEAVILADAVASVKEGNFDTEQVSEALALFNPVVVKKPTTDSELEKINNGVNKLQTYAVSVVRGNYTDTVSYASTQQALQEVNKLGDDYDKRKRNRYRNKYPYGVEEKIDNPASIRIYSESGKVYRVDCFLLQAVQTSQEEKMSMFQSLSGDTLAYFFGKKPVVYRFSAVVYDTYNQQWYNDFMYFYNNSMRGSAAIKHGLRTVIAYEDKVIEGFVINTTSQKSVSAPNAINMDFSMIMLQETVIDYSSPADREGGEDFIDREAQNKIASAKKLVTYQNNCLLGAAFGTSVGFSPISALVGNTSSPMAEQFDPTSNYPYFFSNTDNTTLPTALKQLAEKSCKKGGDSVTIVKDKNEMPLTKQEEIEGKVADSRKSIFTWGRNEAKATVGMDKIYI